MRTQPGLSEQRLKVILLLKEFLNENAVLELVSEALGSPAWPRLKLKLLLVLGNGAAPLSLAQWSVSAVRPDPCLV